MARMQFRPRSFYQSTQCRISQWRTTLKDCSLTKLAQGGSGVLYTASKINESVFVPNIGLVVSAFLDNSQSKTPITCNNNFLCYLLTGVVYQKKLISKFHA